MSGGSTPLAMPAAPAAPPSGTTIDGIANASGAVARNGGLASGSVAGGTATAVQGTDSRDASAQHQSNAQRVQSIAMKLLDVTLQPSSAIVASVAGEFTSGSSNEVACLKAGGTIELYQVSVSEGLKLVFRVETHSVLRSAVAIRFPGEKRDVLAVGADGGALSILDFVRPEGSPAASCKIMHCVVFGKTQCRRSTPGQYLAADPKGRAVMVAAVEKRKLVYVLNRDASQASTLASPLEAHKSRCITFAIVGIDNGFNNPIFACLERHYDEGGSSAPGSSAKQLAYYELDLGLNHVSRKWATSSVPSTACCIVAVPGGESGPGGVLVGGEDVVEYHHQGVDPVSCRVPKRKLQPREKGTLITTLVMFRQKKSKFFALAQSEHGDVFKVTLQMENTVVVGMAVALLDTIPTATSLHVSKLATLFCSSEFGDHSLYQFQTIDLDDAVTCSSSDLGTSPVPEFAPTMLHNLRRLHALPNPSPTSVLVGELAGGEVSPQIYTLAGRGVHSAICVTRHGASVTELAVSELPGVPGGIFTISGAANIDGIRQDRFIVVSFADATLVLSVGETVEEVGKESGFLTNAPTLACSALGADRSMMCQVHPSGVRQIHNGQAKQWHCPGLKRIEIASVNTRQVLIALAGGEVIYFELDSVSGTLTETATCDMGADVSCLDVGTISRGSSRSLFAVVGCRDMTVRVISLDPTSLMVQKSSLALKSRPHSVAIQEMGDDFTLFIGLEDGSSLRANVDAVTGGIASSPTRRFLGVRPVAVSRIDLEAQPAALLLSSRPWITRHDASTGKHVMAPLSYSPLDHGCSFSSDAVSEGVVATTGTSLRILAIDSAVMDGGDNESFNTRKIRLRYTPRQMALLSVTSGHINERRKVVLAVVESDTNEFSLEEKNTMGFDSSGRKPRSADDDDAMEVDSDDEGNSNYEPNQGDDNQEEKESLWTPIRGPVPPVPGYWGSCIRLLDPSKGCDTLDCIELGSNEAALCCASVRFHSKGGESLLAVGTVTGLIVSPLKATASSVVLYRVVNADRFQLLHRTPVDDGPVLALAHFQGRLLVGVGSSLRLYEMGKRQLLRKCELRGLPSVVKTIQTVGDRAFIGDMMRSVLIVRYDSSANRLVLVARDACPRPIVCEELLDWNTVAVGDKYGNISVLRLPRGADSGPIDSTGQRALWDSSRDDGIPKLELLCQYYVGEVVTGMTRSSLVAGGPECLVYVTISGRIGALVPITSRTDVEFYTQLETCLRKECDRPTGRDPLAYRSYYAPVMHVIDGNLCGAFTTLTHDQQSKIAEKLDRTAGEIVKKMEDTKNALL